MVGSRRPVAARAATVQRAARSGKGWLQEMGAAA
jgi:hypothetical protein